MSANVKQASKPATEGSSQKRNSVAEQLAPLQLDKTPSVKWKETTKEKSEPTAKAPTTPYPRSLSFTSEKIVSSRIEELSKLESPILRVLAQRLGALYRIDTKNYDKRNKKHPYWSYEVADKWEEIQGCKNWAGLLDPLDLDLKAEIIRYGEFAQGTYDAFDGDEDSKYCGSCKFVKADMLERIGLENRGYEVVEYIYATAEINLPNFFVRTLTGTTWSKDSNWMGFVAVCTDPEEIARLGRRDILIAWRGTVTTFEWIKDVQDYLAPSGFDSRNEDKGVQVESGFLSVYKSSNDKSRYNKLSAREQVLKAVKDVVETYKHEKKLSITVTGHSLGSALATLCAYDIAESDMNLLNVPSPSVPTDWNSTNKSGLGQKTSLDAQPLTPISKEGEILSEKSINAAPLTESKFPADRIPVTVISFGGPRVGNKAFKARVEELGVSVLRVANVNDLVTKVPGVLQEFLNLSPYKHVGVKLKVDNLKSTYLQETKNPADAHNMEGYMHLVDGFQASNLPYKPSLRDVALVNKTADFLKKEYFIPPSWWQQENKGLVRDKDGHWILPARDAEIFPPTPAPNDEPKEEEEKYQSFWRSVSVAHERAKKKGQQENIPAEEKPQKSATSAAKAS